MKAKTKLGIIELIILTISAFFIYLSWFISTEKFKLNNEITLEVQYWLFVYLFCVLLAGTSVIIYGVIILKTIPKSERFLFSSKKKTIISFSCLFGGMIIIAICFGIWIYYKFEIKSNIGQLLLNLILLGLILFCIGFLLMAIFALKERLKNKNKSPITQRIKKLPKYRLF